MSAQSEALRLADAIDPLTRRNLDNLTCAAAAAELRRLHAERTAADGVINDLVAKVRGLQTQRDALLEALREAEPFLALGVRKKARAAIKAVEENT